MTNLSRRMAHGAAWMLLVKITDRAIGLVSIMILARLLVPADFGLVAIAQAIIAVLALLGAFGFDTALIQNQRVERTHFDTAWTLAVSFAAFCAIALVLLSYPAASFYNEPRLAAIMQVLALSTFIAGFENVGIVHYRKELHFNWEFKFLFIRRFAVFIVTVTLAFHLRNYWALIAGSLCGRVISVALSYLWHPYRPRFSLAASRELFKFSRWLLVSNALGFIYHRSADFIIAKAAGTTVLGQYSVAYEIANLPSSEMAMPINRAVFSGYAKMADDPGALRQSLLSVLALLGLVVIPAAVGLSCLARQVVLVGLGDQWKATIPVVQVLAINGLLTAIMTCCNYAYLALGKARYGTIIVGTHVAMSIPLVAYAAYTSDIVAVAWMILTASLLVIPLNYWFLVTSLKITAADLVRSFWRPTLASGVMAVVVMYAATFADFEVWPAGRVAELLMLVGIGIITYCSIVTLLWVLMKFPAGPERYIWNMLRARWRPQDSRRNDDS